MSPPAEQHDTPWPSDLKEIVNWQQWMQAALIHPDSVNLKEVGERFSPGARLSAVDCLAVYQRGYILRLTRCLAEQFPALCHALGEGLFEQFARRYLQIYPSTSYTLCDLGSRFPQFLEEDRPDRELPRNERETWVDFMVDLSCYERLHFQMFDAPGHEGKSWPDPTVPDHALMLQPCFELAEYRYPVAWYYHAIKDDPDTGFPSRQQSRVVLVRRDYHITTYPLSPVHYLFLDQLRSGADIAGALAHVSNVTQSSLDQVTRSWQHDVRDWWIEAGFFVERDFIE